MRKSIPVKRPTMRAADLGYAPCFLNFFVALCFFHFGSDSALQPQAVNASRYTAKAIYELDMTSIQRNEGRQLFGKSVDNYSRYRPPYPEQIFNQLQKEEKLFPGSHILEVGAGTGLATSRLLELGANHLVIIEPDNRFNPILNQVSHLYPVNVTILNQPFEKVDLAPASFDLAVSATAFHWIDQRIGLRKIAMLLRGDGIWAMWWNIFGDPKRPDPFRRATDKLLKSLVTSPAHAHHAHFALDKDERISDILETGQLTLPNIEEIRWTLHLNITQLRGLYSTFSPIQTQAESDRERILDELVTIAENEFGGVVERPMLTVIYLTRKR